MRKRIVFFESHPAERRRKVRRRPSAECGLARRNASI